MSVESVESMSKTTKLIRELSDLTGAKCGECGKERFCVKHRCCDQVFCNTVEEHLRAQGRPSPKKPHYGGIPYMGGSGCVVAPEDRFFCTAYVCDHHFEDKEFRKKWIDLVRKIYKDPKLAFAYRVPADGKPKTILDIAFNEAVNG